MRPRAWLRAALCLHGVCLSAIGAEVKPVTPLAFEAVAAIRSFEVQGDIGALSPDGRWLAFAVQKGARPRLDTLKGAYTDAGVQLYSAGMSLQLVEISSGQTKQLSPQDASSYGPRWSPDGRLLAYYSDRDGAVRVWIFNPATGEHRRLSDAIARPFFGFEKIRWTPDGRQILVKLLSEGATLEQANAAAQNRLLDGQNDGDKFPGASVAIRRSHAGAKNRGGELPEIMGSMAGDFSDLSLIDIDSGQIRRLLKRTNVTSYRYSPDGSRICAVEWMGIRVGTLNSANRIHLIPVQANRPVVTVEGQFELGYGNTFSWSPDGRRIAFLGSAADKRVDLWIVSAQGDAPRNLTHGSRAKFDATFLPPLWHPDGDRILMFGEGRLWSAGMPQGDVRPLTVQTNLQVTSLLADDTEQRILTLDRGRSAYVQTYDRATRAVGMVKVDLTDGSLTRLTGEQKIYGTNFPGPLPVSRDGKTIVYLSEDSRHPLELWVAGADFSHPRQLSRVNGDFDEYVFGELKLIEWLNGFGDRIGGLLLLPAGYTAGKSYPVITRVYGGYVGARGLNSFGSRWNSFGVEGAEFNNLQVLATRGYAVFTPEIPLRMGTPMTDIPQSVLPGLNKLIEMGIADPDRLGVSGQSHGGYTTLSLLVQTQRFKAAMISAGKSNLLSAYASATSGPGWSEYGQGRMNGSPWEVRENYIENSPFFYFDRIATPLLVVHGEKDSGVPVQHGREIFISLQRLGKEVEMREYHGEDHTIASYENLMDYLRTQVAWFDRYLKAPH